MANEGFGLDALDEVFRRNHIRAIEGGFQVAAVDGVVTVLNSGRGLSVINGRRNP